MSIRDDPSHSISRLVFAFIFRGGRDHQKWKLKCRDNPFGIPASITDRIFGRKDNDIEIKLNKLLENH